MRVYPSPKRTQRICLKQLTRFGPKQVITEKIGACAMTTNFFDNKICNFKILLSWRFPQKKQRFGRFSSVPPRRPPSKTENVIFIVVSPSLRKMSLFEPDFPDFLVYFCCKNCLCLEAPVSSGNSKWPNTNLANPPLSKNCGTCR